MLDKQTQQKNLKLEVLEKFSALITTGLGLVAALAWNEAIVELFNTIFPKPNMLVGKLFYAVFITIIVVVATVKISNVINKIKEKDLEENK